MSDRSHRLLALTLGLTLAVGLSATPALGQSSDDVNVAAASGNAAKVDGKSAVGANASVSARAGKLVATDNQGLLPSNILLPLWSLLQGIPAALADGQITWAEVTGKPAGFADDIDNGAFTSAVSGSNPIPGGATLYPSFSISRLVRVDFEVIPQAVGVFLTHDRTWVVLNADGSTVTYYIQVTNQSGAAGDFRVRLELYSQGITPAALKKQAKNIEFSVSKKPPR
jgi:hypothetical protein